MAVIGGGNSGIEAAIDLSGMARFVTVFEILPELKADQVLIDQAERRSNLRYLRTSLQKQLPLYRGKSTVLTIKIAIPVSVSIRRLTVSLFK